MTGGFILKNATDEELANAVEASLHEMFPSMVQVLNGEIDDTAKPRSKIKTRDDCLGFL
jgi:hypothetical protein